MGSIPGLVHWVKGFSVAIAAAQIQFPAWELSYAIGVAIKKKRKKKKKKNVQRGRAESGADKLWDKKQSS